MMRPEKKKSGTVKNQGENGVNAVERQPPVGDIGGQDPEGCVGDVDDLHHSPGEAETHAEQGKDPSHEKSAHHGLKDDNGVEHRIQGRSSPLKMNSFSTLTPASREESGVVGHQPTSKPEMPGRHEPDPPRSGGKWMASLEEAVRSWLLHFQAGFG